MIVGARQDAEGRPRGCGGVLGLLLHPFAARSDSPGRDRLAIVHLDLVATTADVDVVPSAESVPKVQMAPRMKTKDPVPRDSVRAILKVAELARESYWSRGIP